MRGDVLDAVGRGGAVRGCSQFWWLAEHLLLCHALDIHDFICPRLPRREAATTRLCFAKAPRGNKQVAKTHAKTYTPKHVLFLHTRFPLMPQPRASPTAVAPSNWRRPWTQQAPTSHLGEAGYCPSPVPEWCCRS